MKVSLHSVAAILHEASELWQQNPPSENSSVMINRAGI